MKTKFKYAPDPNGIQDAYEIESVFDRDDPDWLAEECAEDYHSNHDGWEAIWPVVFTLWTADGEEIGQYEVERHSQPVFEAREYKPRNITP